MKESLRAVIYISWLIISSRYVEFVSEKKLINMMRKFSVSNFIKVRFLKFFLLFLFLTGVHNILSGNAATAEERQVISLLENQIKEKLVQLTAYTIELEFDPFYQQKKKYEGYRLSEVLSSVFLKYKNHKMIRFVASDGYKVTSFMNELPLEKGYLVYKDIQSSNPLGFDEILEGKSKYNPAPFALIWEGQKGLMKELPNPFSIVALEIGKESDFFGAAFPQKNKKVVTGFYIFNTHCLKCHSMNKQGGMVGPELNVPRNIFEYWKKEEIRNVIRNPGDLRWGSKMPPYKDVLTVKELEELLRYLEWMKHEKICTSDETCRH
jgi:mono/diheme cytochrome c family protein